MSKKTFLFWSVLIATAFFRLSGLFAPSPPSLDSCLKKITKGSGFIVTQPESKESGQVFVISPEKLSISATGEECQDAPLIRVKTKLYPKFFYGNFVTFEGKLLEPINFDSGDRTFDYVGYLAKDDIHFEMKSALVKVSDDAQTSLSSKLFGLKRSFISNLDKTLGEPHGALAAGLVVGEKAALGKDLLEAFRIVGLIHIVVLSGYNITIVGETMRKLLSFLPRVWGIIFGAIGIILFGILVGGGATVVRSCFMASIALFADLIRRDYNVPRALILAGLIMVIQNPLILLHDPSFQLSFLATLGLILLASPIEAYLGWVPERFGIRGIVASTFATQIFVSPFILHMMGQISIIGLVVNILVLPFIPLTMLFVFLQGLAGFIYMPLATFVGWGSHLLLSYELFMVNSFAKMPFASLTVPPFSWWWVGAFYGVFGVGWVIAKIFLKSKNQKEKLR
ncbi:MAG: ComEC/Rec2 family competence protein [Candidatus Paceibacterota bacterium]